MDLTKQWKSVEFGKNRYFPSKIVCVGRNFIDHIRELNNPIPSEPVLFIKPNSALSSELYLPTEPFRYETEIAFLIEGNAFRAVGIGIDLTLSELQEKLKKKRLPWEKAKAFDGSAVISEFVELPGELSSLSLETEIDGELRQKASVREMLFSPERILVESLRYFSLYDGDIIFTGTPAGVGGLREGQSLKSTLFWGERPILKWEWVAKVK